MISIPDHGFHMRLSGKIEGREDQMTQIKIVLLMIELERLQIELAKNDAVIEALKSNFDIQEKRHAKNLGDIKEEYKKLLVKDNGSGPKKLIEESSYEENKLADQPKKYLELEEQMMRLSKELALNQSEKEGLIQQIQENAKRENVFNEKEIQNVMLMIEIDRLNTFISGQNHLNLQSLNQNQNIGYEAAQISHPNIEVITSNLQLYSINFCLRNIIMTKLERWSMLAKTDN